MFTTDDLNMLAGAANDFFANLPKQAKFSFKWWKPKVTPGGKTYPGSPAYENIPGVKLPHVQASESSTPEFGKTTLGDTITVIVPKKWGETITISDITYVGGIQYQDKLQTQDGEDYIVTSKESRGYGAYYVLVLATVKGLDTDFIKGQV